MKKNEHIPGSDFYKSLEKLEAMAKGEDMNKSQITQGGNSEPAAWAGSTKKEIGDKWDDSIAKDGTDYNGAKTRKSIMDKVAKGEPLSVDELTLLKGDIDSAEMSKAKKDKEEDDEDDKKAPPFPFGGKDKEEEKKDDDKKICKSFTEAVTENDTLQKGIEVSDFLAEFAKSFAYGLEGLESRIERAVTGALRQFAGEQGEFNKSLAEAVVNIGHGIATAMKNQVELADSPVGPPKSQMNAGAVQVMQKSFAGSEPGAENISKSMMLDKMGEMVEKGQLSGLELIKFEATGEIRPDLRKSVILSLNSGR